MDKIKTLAMAAVVLVVMFFALSLLPGAALSFVSSVFAVLVLVGMGVYLLDQHPWWQGIYRFTYDFCHKNPMPLTESDGRELVRGVVLNQPTNVKMRRAGYISLIAFFYTVWELKFGVSFWIQMLLGFLDVPAVLAGFALGYWAYESLIKNHEKLADQFDSIGDTVQNISVQEVKDQIKGATGGVMERLKNLGHTTAPKEAPSAPAPTPTPEPPADFRAALRKFTGRP